MGLFGFLGDIASAGQNDLWITSSTKGGLEGNWDFPVRV